MENAFGGVVVNAAGWILLREVARHWDGYVWTFPKGRPDPGETPEEAALRELLAETGATARIIGRLPGSFPGGTTDNVYFVMQLQAHERDPDPKETASVRWCTPEEALMLIASTTNVVGRRRDVAVVEAYRHWCKHDPRLRFRPPECHRAPVNRCHAESICPTQGAPQ